MRAHTLETLIMRARRLFTPVLSVVISACACTTLPAQTSQPAATAATVQTAPLQFTLTYDQSITDTFTGRVYVMFTKSTMGEPRFGPSWFGADPFFAMDVTGWKPDTPLVFDDQADSFPSAMSAVPEKDYSIQAVMRRNLDSPDVGRAEGDAYSKIIRKPVNGASSGNIELVIDKVVPAPEPGSHHAFRETDRVKLIEMRSDLLSGFFHRDIIMRAAVVLPKDYDKHPDWKYPVLYWIGGFGSDHHQAGYMTPMWDYSGFAERIVRVVLDPQCYGGHHVFADSANNGPRGKALVEEFIPYLESKYRIVPDANARFLSGHSSGGWSSLWLQVTYPDYFGGVWSIAPDPIDFRDFQRIDLYTAGTNMYVDAQGERRPLARMNGKVALWYNDFAMMDSVIGEGGQLRSFEWVFSQRGADGKPQPLYDRTTGAVNPAVAESWKPYDIRMILEDHWATLGPKLNGGEKLHVFAGELDTFYLEGAVRLLKDSMQKLNSAAVVEIVPGKDHTSIATKELRKRTDEELLAVFEKNHPDHIRPRAYD